jgi:hypothetical protein
MGGAITGKAYSLKELFERSFYRIDYYRFSSPRCRPISGVSSSWPGSVRHRQETPAGIG